jgi:hypothetical protein
MQTLILLAKVIKMGLVEDSSMRVLTIAAVNFMVSSNINDVICASYLAISWIGPAMPLDQPPLMLAFKS